ncbi:MAG: DMT family transporter [Gammaproteobacteria bacterium]|nr:DMT family transporter [Gammaproteobacteria bacterium]
MTQYSSNFSGFSLAIIGTLLFSLKSIFIKYLYQLGLDPNQILSLRMLLALPFYLFILFWLSVKKKSIHNLNRDLLIKVFLLGFLGYYLASLLDLISLTYISAQLERLGLFTYPFMVAILGYLFFKQAMTRSLIIALILSYLGLWLVVSQERMFAGDQVVLGTLFVLGSALSYSIYVLFAQNYIKQLGSTLFTTLAMISSSIYVFIHAYFTLNFKTAILTSEVFMWLFLLAFFSTVIPSYMLTAAIHRIGPSQTGLVGILGPVFTIVLAIFLLDENFTLIMALGVTMVISGVLLKMKTA